MRQTLHLTHPQLATELVDQQLATSISRGSSRKVQWQCHRSHTWWATPNSRTGMGSGCPVCAGKQVAPGLNDLASCDPDLAAQLVDPQQATTVTLHSNKRLTWCCEHDHTWTASVNTRSNGHGCPVCAGKQVAPGFNDLASTHPEVAALLVHPREGESVTASASRPLEWACPSGHTWSAPVSRVVRGSRCPVCFGKRTLAGTNDLLTTHPEVASELVDQHLASTLRAGSNTKVWWQCPEGHTWQTSPNNRTRTRGTGCPVCTGRVVVPGVNDLGTTHPEIAIQGPPELVTSLSRGSKKPVRWTCPSGHQWTARPNDRSAKGSGCPQCAASSFVSRGERALADQLTSLLTDHEVRRTVRDLVPGQELDIVVPDLGLAVEFNGTFFHCEQFKSPSYHRDKSRAAQVAGLHLVHVWSDDWQRDPALVLRSLAHRLGATEQLARALPEINPGCTVRTMARALRPTLVDGRRAAAFLRANHLQGAVTATYHLGLVDDTDQICALLSIRSPRAAARARRAEGVWEIQRYATRGVVAGGFTRLLTHAKRVLSQEGRQLEQWVSFSDDALSDGGLYQTAGFTVDRRLPPSHWYVGNPTGWHRRPKEAYQKKRFATDPDLLWDEAWTEHAAALANGLYRLHDAGRTRWVKPID